MLYCYYAHVVIVDIVDVAVVAIVGMGRDNSVTGIVRDTGGHAVATLAAMRSVYGASRDDVFWAASDVGWVVGHGNTLSLFLLFVSASVYVFICFHYRILF